MRQKTIKIKAKVVPYDDQNAGLSLLRSTNSTNNSNNSNISIARKCGDCSGGGGGKCNNMFFYIKEHKSK